MHREEKYNQEGKIHRKDSAHTASVEHSEIVRRLTGIEQYPADQESRENEEEVDAGPTEIYRKGKK
jgi:hypothetical protein